MEQRGTTVVPLADLDDLHDLVSRPGPFLSATLAYAPVTEALAEEVRLRWEGQRRSLAADGAPDGALDVVSTALEEDRRGAGGLAVVVPGEGDPLVERLAAPPEEAAAWGPVPVFRPLLAARQRHLAHVVALVDRTGADLRVRTVGDPGAEVDLTVEGEDDVVRKVAGGGWSQRRFQQRAEDSWHHNMARVADELAEVADRVRAPVVAVGGDERAVGHLLDALPVAVRERVSRIGATRAPDGSSARLDAEVDAELDAWVADRIGAALALHAEELGQGDRATSGAGRTLEALRAARVALLLVAERADAAAEGRQAWVGPGRDQVATTPGDLTEPDAAVAAPLLDAAVAAALATGAGVLVVPAGDDGDVPGQLRDGLGALLRW